MSVEFDEFGWTSLREEAERQGVTIEELLAHAAMYYLSDLDSGRAAVQIFRRSQEVEEGGADVDPPTRFGREASPPSEGGED